MIFQMSKKERLSNDEIADQLHISKKTVENHLTNAKAFIMKKLKDDRIIISLFFFWMLIKL